MRATIIFGTGDVRIETVPDARIIKPTDAVVAVSRACICGRRAGIPSYRWQKR
jgi:threonine dehydrogenase-like Zn-dependent dehydrogenase